MKKLDFLFIFLAVLLSADYLTTLAGINRFEEMNEYVVAVNSFIGNWFITLTALFAVKILALIGLYKLASLKIRQVKRSSVGVSLILAFCYFIIVLNNIVLVSGAENYCEFIAENKPECAYSGFISYATSVTATASTPSQESTNNANQFLKYIKNIKGIEIDRISIYGYTINAVYRPYSNYPYCSSGNELTPYFGEHYRMVYSGTQVGDCYLFSGEDVIIIDCVWNENLTSVPDSATITASFVNRWYYDNEAVCDPEPNIYPIPQQADGSFSNPIFNNKIYTYWDRPIEDNAFGDIYIVYNIKNELNISYCKDEIEYHMFWQSDVPIDGGYYSSSGSLLQAIDNSDIGNYNNVQPFYLKIYTGVQTLSYDFNDELSGCEWVQDVKEGQVKFVFLDARTSALLDSVNFSLSGDDFSDSGVYDYYITYNSSQLTEGNTYSYSATKEGYQPISGSFVFQGGQVIKLYFVPTKSQFEDEMENATANTIVTFKVIDSETKEPVSGAVVTLQGFSKIANENGFTWFEVVKNATYSYTVSAEGYYSVSGSVSVGVNQTDLTVELIPTSVIETTTTTTATAGGGGNGDTTGGTGGLEEGINNLYSAAPTLLNLAILVAIMSFLGMLTRPFRRRR